MYSRLTGCSPFQATNLDKLVTDISTVSISSECNSHLSTISSDCYDLVFKGLLVLNPRYYYYKRKNNNYYYYYNKYYYYYYYYYYY